MVSKVTGSQDALNQRPLLLSSIKHAKVAGNRKNERYSPYPKSQRRKLGQHSQQTTSQVRPVLWGACQVLAPGWTKRIKEEPKIMED